VLVGRQYVERRGLQHRRWSDVLRKFHVRCARRGRQANYSAGNLLAQFVFGPGIKLSVEDDPAKTVAANPATYVTPSSPPFVLLHGSADQLVSPSQTLTLHNALRAKGVDSTRYVVTGANHGDLTFMTGDTNAAKQWSSQQLVGDIVSFQDKHLG
jgi:dipeptidyl aminopeptidase/acylaminoacyl peptidase